MTVTSIVTPVAVVIEIVKANNVMRKILRGARTIVAVFAGFDPCVKRVGFLNRFYVGV